MIWSQRSITKPLSLFELSVQESVAASVFDCKFAASVVAGGSASAVPQRSIRVPLVAVKAVQVGRCRLAAPPDSSNTALHAISATNEHFSERLTCAAVEGAGAIGCDHGEVEQAVNVNAKARYFGHEV